MAQNRQLHEWCSTALSEIKEVMEVYGSRVREGAENTVIYTERMVEEKTEITECPMTQVSVLELDSFDACEKLVKWYPDARVAVMNMASEICPGGGWKKGSKAQEESLFYRSTLSVHLDGRMWPNHTPRAIQYPLRDPLTVIYSPDVCVFKRSDYSLLDYPDCWFINVITVAGLRRPNLTGDGHLIPNDRKLLRAKIEQFLDVAVKHKIDCLVLGALGCGAFANPPNDVAAEFATTIHLAKYKGKFRRIVFAVLGQPNFVPFKTHLHNTS